MGVPLNGRQDRYYQTLTICNEEGAAMVSYARLTTYGNAKGCGLCVMLHLQSFVGWYCAQSLGQSHPRKQYAAVDWQCYWYSQDSYWSQGGQF